VVVCIGVATLDAIVAVERLPGPDERVDGVDGRLAGGGVAATAAVTLARLGVPVAFVGRVADDTAGRWIRDDLADEGVDVVGLSLAEGRSPLSAALVERGSGGRALAPFPGTAGQVQLSAHDLQRCAMAAWVHVDHAGLATVPSLAAAGVRTAISFDGGVDVRGLSLRGIDLYAPTETALERRYPDRDLDNAMAAALDEGPRLVVVTRGTNGSVALERDGATGAVRRHEASAFAIEAAGGSTLGAGDVFHGAFLAALVDGAPVPEALNRANVCAALACRALDGRSAIPTRTELDAFLGVRISHA
jgi:sulfofructose kinase